jgi:hypothetical protein
MPSSRLMSLSDKPANWPAEVSASPEILQSAATLTVLRHALSTATSRKPQNFLWESVKDRLESILLTDAGASVLVTLVTFATPKTIEALAEKLSAQTETDSVIAVVAAIAERIDDPSDSRRTLVQKALAAVKPSSFISAGSTRTLVAKATADEDFKPAALKILRSKPVSEWMRASASGKQSSKDWHTFLSDVLRCSGKCQDAEFRTAVGQCVVTAWGELMAAKASHRPRPDELQQVAAQGSEDLVSNIASRVASWSDLQTRMLGSHVRVVASLIERSDVESARNLAAAVLKAAPLTEITSKSFSSARIAVAMRSRGVIGDIDSGASAGRLDAAQDDLKRQQTNAALAAREAANREVARLQVKQTSSSRRPALAVLERDDEGAPHVSTRRVK